MTLNIRIIINSDTYYNQFCVCWYQMDGKKKRPDGSPRVNSTMVMKLDEQLTI